MPSPCSSTNFILLRNGAANWLSPACRSAVCSKRALRSPRVQFARSDWSSCSCAAGHGRQQLGPQLVVGDVGIEQHGAEPAVALNDPVDGVALRLEHVVEAVFDPLPIPVEELAVHVDGLVERVAPRLVQEAHQREVTAWAAILRTRSADAVRTLWNRIRW